MSESIDFYFDFSSPYGYLASTRIDTIAGKHGRSVTWRPYMMGVAMKLSGAKPLVELPLIGDYSRRDFERSARLIDVPFTLPQAFPIAALAPTRAYYWVETQDPELAKSLARAIYSGYFGEGRNVCVPESVADIAASLGIAREDILAGMNESSSKERVKRETSTAIDRGVFGSPFVIVDGEPFWGNERLDQVDRWLETGGW